MSDNSSSFTCMVSADARITSVLFMAALMVLVLPLSVLVLYLGWRRRGSSAVASHSDILTYNVAAMVLIYGLGSPANFVGVYMRHYELMMVGYFACVLIVPGQMLFHILTCVERYLAVVHPVTYLGLRQGGGVRIRNASVACVWLLSFGWSGLSILCYPNIPYALIFSSLVFSLVIVSFCSVRVLCVLIGPRPGEVGGNRERVDQSKQRAFHTIAAITGVLWLWFGGGLVCVGLQRSTLLEPSVGCVVLALSVWFSLPGYLLLPLLFLHRAGKSMN